MSGSNFEARSVTVRLGNCAYVVTEAGYLRSRQWRVRFAEEVKPIFEQIARASEMTFDSPADLLKLAPLLDVALIDGIDKIFELLLAYSDELGASRSDIEKHATDRQILDAFREVASLALPFDLGAMLRKFGPQATGTLSSLPSANGVAPLPKPSRSPKRK